MEQREFERFMTVLAPVLIFAKNSFMYYNSAKAYTWNLYITYQYHWLPYY